MTRKTFLGLAGVLLVGCLLAGASLITEKCIPKTEWDGGQYRIEDVNALDAHFAQPYDKLRDDVGTVHERRRLLHGGPARFPGGRGQKEGAQDDGVRLLHLRGVLPVHKRHLSYTENIRGKDTALHVLP